MAGIESKQESYAQHVLVWAKACGDIVEDVSRALIGFVPNGLQHFYDMTFKSLPVIGNFFAQRWVEKIIKLVTGITIGQGLAADIAYFIFKPIGFTLGALIGTGVITQLKSVPAYHGQFGKFLGSFSGQAVGGGLIGLLILFMSQIFFPGLIPQISYKEVSIAIGIGAFFGLFAKSLLYLAIKSVNNANATAIRKNGQRAKELNSKLKATAKQKAKSRILMQAQDIIQQMNGPQSQQYLEEFFNHEYEAISASTDKKIERHFDYLTDRAICGDIKALNRMQELNLVPKQGKDSEKNIFETMLDRLFNARAIAKLKDDVDTQYDRWHYGFLRAKEG